ncbi:MAG: hypothetical protein GWO24_33700, partial [Akkermansiaceae bacterium]|nr:hypothetical protein [Akkermansiaceae bacterium]
MRSPDTLQLYVNGTPVQTAVQNGTSDTFPEWTKRNFLGRSNARAIQKNEQD